MYVLVAIVKKRLGIQADLYTFLQALSLTLFEKTPLFAILSDEDYTDMQRNNPNQMNLFDYFLDTSDPGSGIFISYAPQYADMCKTYLSTCLCSRNHTFATVSAIASAETQFHIFSIASPACLQRVRPLPETRSTRLSDSLEYLFLGAK